VFVFDVIKLIISSDFSHLADLKTETYKFGMLKHMVVPTSKEVKMKPEDMIVSKTDIKGHITYCNDAFMEFAGYYEEELLGQSHSIIRHPDMPRAVFRLLWNKLHEEEEFFGFIKNMCKDGSFYWTYSNIFLNFGAENELLGYMSVRRYPPVEGVEFFQNLYQKMLEVESQYEGSREGMDASWSLLQEVVSEKGGYDQYVCSYFK
jgi:PAS domain S-box-containing protein